MLQSARRNEAQVARDGAAALSSTPSSVFDLCNDSGADSLDWGSIYYYIGLASSAASEIIDSMQLACHIHRGIESDPRVADVIAEAKALRNSLQHMAGAAYAREREQHNS